MGWFSGKPVEIESSRMINELGQVKSKLDNLLAKLEGKVETENTSAALESLKRQLAQKQIDWDREKEKWDREKREVEHMVGLQKKRADQERDLAVKQAELEVREGNLQAKEELFEERITALTEGLERQVEYLRKDIIQEILKRLPIFNVETALEPHRLLSNGGGKD